LRKSFKFDKPSYANIFLWNLEKYIMSNKGIGSKKQHGHHKINERRAKTTLSQRRNKAKAAAKRAILREKGFAC